MQEYLKLKPAGCKDCYKCIRSCPVKAISFADNQAQIIEDECILCGQCYVVCPQNAKQVRSDVARVREAARAGKRIIASVAPSFIAGTGFRSIEDMADTLRQLGFAGAEETAIGAQFVSREYERLIQAGDNLKGRVMITSCCPAINSLIQKYYPDLLDRLARVLTPMQAHCTDIKKRIPNARTVFVGPCVAKKDEAQYYEGIVDAVLTYDELTAWLKSENIELRREIDKNEKSRARFFPTTGGILKTMTPENSDYTYMAIDGTENCMAALRDIEEGKLHHCFIEMSACVGSCIGGPVMEKFHRSPVKDYIAVSNFAGREDFDIPQPDALTLHKTFTAIEHKLKQPSETEIKETLRQMGKVKPSDELNCGSCGYDTCREKAIAILQGKAEISMCLPYLKDKAESFSDTIVRNTPNGLIVLNEKLEVQQINRVALKILNIRYASDIMGDQVVRVMEPGDFMSVLSTGRDIHNKRVYLAEYEKYVDETIVYDREYRLLVCILRDVTEEETQREKKENISRQTVEIADRVVDKQMRIVQEIASLLGETAAETKIALTKLQESISDE